MPQTTQEYVRGALLHLEQKNYDLAECLALDYLEEHPADAAMMNVVARIALAVGRPDTAVEFLERAAAADPYFKPASKNLAEARKALQAPRTAASGEKHLLILSWGCGFWSDVDHVLSSALTAELCGRTPTVWWGAGSMFSEDPAKNAWTEFFEPISAADPQQVVRDAGGALFPNKWNAANVFTGALNRVRGPGSKMGALHFMSRPERVCVSDFHTGVYSQLHWIPREHAYRGLSTPQVYRALIGKYLRPRAEVVSRVDELEREVLGAGAAQERGPRMAVHFRGSDKIAEFPSTLQRQNEYHEHVRAFLASDPRAKVFLLTDFAPVLEQYVRAYGDRIVTTTCVRTSTEVGTHFYNRPDRVRLGMEVLIDALLATRCDRFLGIGHSNVSCMIRDLKEWPEGCAHLVGIDSRQKRNLFLLATNTEQPGGKR